jgi:hypothetical protein
MNIRRVITWREELHEVAGREVVPPISVGLAAVVIANPWVVDGFVDDLQPVARELAPELGAFLAERVVDVVGAPIEAYGKAAIVGLDGEVEHGSALIHTLLFGNAFRDAVSAETLLPAVEKRAAAGSVFDIPLKHVVDATTRSHHQTLEARIAGAPAPDEIVVALAGATGGRPHARLPSFASERQALDKLKSVPDLEES